MTEREEQEVNFKNTCNKANMKICISLPGILYKQIRYKDILTGSNFDI